MKALKLVALGIVLFFASSAQAQISVHFNIGTPPAWGPSGYSDVQYYYLPDVEAYYDVNSSMFIYYEGRSWVRRSYLPSRYRNYDLYGGYKVVMNGYHGKTPYYNHREYRTKYAKGYRGQSQKTIGQRPGRGNSSKGYRQSNQVNRGRGTEMTDAVIIVTTDAVLKTRIANGAMIKMITATTKGNNFTIINSIFNN